MKVTDFYNLLKEVMSFSFTMFFWLESQSLDPAHTQGEGNSLFHTSCQQPTLTQNAWCLSSLCLLIDKVASPPFFLKKRGIWLH